MAKDGAPTAAAVPKPVRFREKHAFNAPSARELLEGGRPLQPTPGVSPSCPLCLPLDWKSLSASIKCQHRSTCAFARYTSIIPCGREIKLLIAALRPQASQTF